VRSGVRDGPDPGPDPGLTPGLDAELSRVVRREAAVVVAHLHRRTGDFDVAEEAVQEALVEALRTWPSRGVPPNPAGWLTTTAQRRAIDLLRVRSRHRRLAAAAGEALPDPPTDPGGGTPDERLPMLFACCHPALSAEARLALTLRAVLGLTTAQVARAFLVPEATVAQRLVRAKRKIVAAGIPFSVPDGDRLPARLDDVLTVVCLAYNASYLDPDGAAGPAGDAVWLAEVVARAVPRQSEAWGLLALLTFLQARDPARFDPAGALVPPALQDRSRWDTVAISRADGYLARAAAQRSPGRWQLQAAIAGCHCSAARWEDTDWWQVLTLYDLLVVHDPSPVVRLNHAVALSHVRGPRAALAAVDALAARLDGYHLLHATRAELLTALGRADEAREANARALALSATPAEQALLRTRLD
jgi:RNA polymerase sigma factor (sigma-70 family)